MDKIKKLPAIIAGTLLALSSTILAVNGTVNAPSGLVLRGEPEKNGSIITTVEDKAQVEVIEESGEWYKVKYNGQEGYLFGQYVAVEEDVTPATPTEQPTENPTTNEGENTNTQTVNEIEMYMVPVLTASPIKVVPKETPLTVQRTITNWSYVTDGTDEGWVRTALINGTVITAPASEETPAPEQNEPTPATETKPEENPAEQPENKPEEKPTETPATTAPNDNSSEGEKTTTAKRGEITVKSANVRKTAATSSDIVTNLTLGTQFEINAETTEWYKIKYTAGNGTVYEGYIYKNLMKVVQ